MVALIIIAVAFVVLLLCSIRQGDPAKIAEAEARMAKL